MLVRHLPACQRYEQQSLECLLLEMASHPCVSESIIMDLIENGRLQPRIYSRHLADSNSVETLFNMGSWGMERLGFNSLWCIVHALVLFGKVGGERRYT